MMRFAINSNPFISQMARQNPELEYILNNPEMLRSMLTPENMRMAMGMMQSMRGMPGANPMFGMGMGMPGAAPATTGAATSGAAATGTATTGTATTGAATPPPAFPGFDYNMLSQMMAGYGAPPAQPAASTAGTSAPAATTAPPTSAVPSTGPAPAPAPGAWQPPAYPFGNLSQMMRMFGPPPASTAPTAPTAPAAAPVDPKVKYATQLEKMKEMGFTNEDVNLDALKITNGNIEAAIERILTMLK